MLRSGIPACSLQDGFALASKWAFCGLPIPFVIWLRLLATRKSWPSVVLPLFSALLSKPRQFALLAGQISLFVLKIGVCDTVFSDWGLRPQSPWVSFRHKPPLTVRGNLQSRNSFSDQVSAKSAIVKTQGLIDLGAF